VRTVYIGTSRFALEVLEASGLEPALVVTRPPSARGRGRHLEPSPVAVAARAVGLAVREPERLEEVAGEIDALAPDLVCLCAYGALVREPLLSRHEILGVHPSLLPRWRGAAPIERAIMAGDARTGVSILRLVAELDAGPVCAIAELEVAGGEDYGSLAARLAPLGGALLAGAVAGPREYAPQPGAGVTYAEKITAADRVLDPGRSAVELERVVRALHPHIGARLASGLGVLEARLAADPEPPPVAGALVSAADGRLYFGAGDGTLELVRVRPPGGREMDGAAYARGHVR
jgi:methionyl-tRNA formyltransferase